MGEEKDSNSSAVEEYDTIEEKKEKENLQTTNILIDTKISTLTDEKHKQNKMNAVDKEESQDDEVVADDIQQNFESLTEVEDVNEMKVSHDQNSRNVKCSDNNMDEVKLAEAILNEEENQDEVEEEPEVEEKVEEEEEVEVEEESEKFEEVPEVETEEVVA